MLLVADGPFNVISDFPYLAMWDMVQRKSSDRLLGQKLCVCVCGGVLGLVCLCSVWGGDLCLCLFVHVHVLYL